MMRYSLVLLVAFSLCSAGCSLIGGNDDDEMKDWMQPTRENAGTTLSLSFASSGAKGQTPQRKEINTSIFIAIPLGADGTLDSCSSCLDGSSTELDADIFYKASFSTDSMEVRDIFHFKGLELQLEDFEINDTLLRGAFRLKAEQVEGVRRQLVFLDDGQTSEVVEPMHLTTNGTIRVEGDFSFTSKEVIVRYDKAVLGRTDIQNGRMNVIRPNSC